MSQLSFDDLSEREKRLKEKEDQLAAFCRQITLTLSEAESEAIAGKDQSIRAGKLFVIKRIRSVLQKLPS